MVQSNRKIKIYSRDDKKATNIGLILSQVASIDSLTWWLQGAGGSTVSRWPRQETVKHVDWTSWWLCCCHTARRRHHPTRRCHPQLPLCCTLTIMLDPRAAQPAAEKTERNKEANKHPLEKLWGTRRQTSICFMNWWAFLRSWATATTQRIVFCSSIFAYLVFLHIASQDKQPLVYCCEYPNKILQLIEEHDDSGSSQVQTGFNPLLTLICMMTQHWHGWDMFRHVQTMTLIRGMWIRQLKIYFLAMASNFS